MHHAPHRRAYPQEEAGGRPRLRDVDAAARIVRLKGIVWGLYLGVLGGIPVGAAIGLLTGANPLVAAAVGFVLMQLGVPLLAGFITNRTADAFQALYSPSGDSTPYRREYSYAESLVTRGQYGDATAAYELYVLENPRDPEPYLRLARLYRDKLNQYEDAVTWFRRARSDSDLAGGQHMLVIQELVEIYTRKLKMPRKAIPELALLVERYPGTPAAEAARRELAEMREMLERERVQMIPFTVQFLRKVGRGSVGAAASEAAAELERHMVREVLAECGGDRVKAAERLGVSVEELEEKLLAVKREA